MNHLLPPDPGRPRSNAGLFVLTGALVASLLLNLTLGVVLQDARSDDERLRDRVAQLQDEIEELTGAPPGAGASLADISRAVARLRGLAFEEPVEPEVLTRDALAARVRALFEEDTPRDEVDATERVLQTLGVASPEQDLWAALVAAHEEQVAGFYDNRDGTLVVMGEEIADPRPFTRLILAHELTHALTDQHFDLGRLDRLRERGADDEAAAFLALVEGDATLLMTQYLSAEMTPQEQLEAASEQGSGSEAFDAMPAFLQRSITFPYTEGLAFVRALFDRGGFDAVDRAYRRPPTSTEQILHPERYAGDRDDPVRVRLPAVRSALGGGWTRLIGGGVGELDVLLMLDEQVRSQGLSSSDASIAAEGWDGGSYVALGDGDRTLVAMLTAWDSDAEASQAADAVGEWLPLRYGNRGSRIEDGFRGDDGTGVALQRGDRVLVILGPDDKSVRDARSAFDGF